MRTSIADQYFFYAKTFDEKYDRMKALGYDCIDASLEETEYPYYASYEAMEEHCKTVRDAADRHGLTIYQVHASFGVWYDKGNREDNIKDIVRILKMGLYGTSILGAKNYVVHPVCRIGFWNNGFDLAEPERTEYTVEVMKQLLPMCEEYGIKLCLENLTDYQIPDVLEVIKTLDSPYVGICLDTGHASVSHVDMGDIVRQCGKYLASLHIHDTNGRYDLHLPPFMGVVNWDHFTDAIAEIGYNGTLNLESEINRGATMPLEFAYMLEEYSARAVKHLADEVEKKRK